MNLLEALNNDHSNNLKERILLLGIPEKDCPKLKSERVRYLHKILLSGQFSRYLVQMTTVERQIVAEVAHNHAGYADGGRLQARYGDSIAKALPWIAVTMHLMPKDNTLGKSLLGVIFYEQCIPEDFRQKLARFLPKPEQDKLISTPEKSIPTHVTRGKCEIALQRRDMALVVQKDLYAVLTLVEQGVISVSEKTKAASAASMKKIAAVLQDGDFFSAQDEDKNAIHKDTLSPIRAYAWPLLLQKGGLTKRKGIKLQLSHLGNSTLQRQAVYSKVIKQLYQCWRDNKNIDEFHRINRIKGQIRRGKTSPLTPPAPRRLALQAQLEEVPIGEWIPIEEWLRYIQSSGKQFEITRNPAQLYLTNPGYGNLGSDEPPSFSLLQGRYAMVYLFEYLATLGMVDLIYSAPDHILADYHAVKRYNYLSRYDGLGWFRLNALGAYCLEKTDTPYLSSLQPLAKPNALQRFVATYSPDPTQHAKPLLAANDLNQLTPVLVEAALQLDPRVSEWYELWYEDIFSSALDRFEKTSSFTPQDSKALHTEVEYSIFDGLDKEDYLSELQYWLNQDTSAYGKALGGVLSFFTGAPQHAIQQYKYALRQLHKENKKPQTMILGLPGLFFVLASIQRGELTTLLSPLVTLRRQYKMHSQGDCIAAIFDVLIDFVQVSNMKLAFDESIWLHPTKFDAHPWQNLFQGLALHWMGKPLPKKLTILLSQQIDKATECQLYWYVNEATALIDAIAGAPPEETSGAFLVSLYQATALWEQRLAKLDKIPLHRHKENTELEKIEVDNRLVWWIYPDNNSASLQAREQRRNKKGNWSKGRTIALARLKDEQESFTYLTAKDREICNTIHKEFQRNYGFYVDTSYSLRGEKALRAAMGHPNLYRGDKEGQDQRTITIEESTPRLEVIENQADKTIHIQIYPYVKTKHKLTTNFFCHWQDPYHLQITQFSDDQLEIAKLLTAQGLAAPLIAKERIIGSLSALAPLLTIHSDIGGGPGTAQEVVADKTPHFHLYPLKQDKEPPLGMGLHLSLCHYPLGEQGPTFPPGEGRATLFIETEGKTKKTVRDLSKEVAQATELVDTLQLSTLATANEENAWQWTLNNPEQALDTLLALQEMGDQIVIAWPQGEKISLTKEVSSSKMQVSIGKQRDWFNLSGTLQIGEEQVIEMGKLLDLLQQTSGRFLRLDDGRLLTLSRQLRRQLDSLNTLQDQGKVHPFATVAVEEATQGMQVAGGKPWREQLGRLREAESLQPELPSTLEAELRDYQIEGYRWLARLAHWGAGACLADDMGLGKTLQALAMLVQQAAQGPSLVVAPTSVCSNWIEESGRFAPTLRPQRFGDGDRKQTLETAGPFDLIICSYGLLQSEIEQIQQINWHIIVADEAQAFKNSHTKRSQAMMSLQSTFRIITTGTPIENHLGELWNLFRFINPGLLGSLERFKQRFANPIEIHHDEAARLQLKSLIHPFILRRLKRNVLTELPARTEITHYVECSDEEASFYEALRRQAMERLAELPTHPGQQRLKVLTEITRLRQAACHPRLVIPDSPISSAKLRAFITILEELQENNHRALVFSQFVRHLALIREYLDEHKIPYQYLDGSTNIKKRKAAVDSFQAGEGQLFLISLKAGGSGLNLTAADYVIHMDPWWNPAVEDQASDRAHRMGQTRPVTIYRLVVKDTIEEKIVALHAHKRDLADGLLEGSDIGVRLTVEDLVHLISGQE